MNISSLLKGAIKHPVGTPEREHLCAKAILDVLSDKADLVDEVYIYNGYFNGYFNNNKSHVTEVTNAIGDALTLHTMSFAKAFIKLIKTKQLKYPTQFLRSAVKCGNLELAKFLVEDCGESLDQFDVYNRSILDTACSSKQFEMAKWLINNNISLPTTPEYDESLKNKSRNPENYINNTGTDVTDYLFAENQIELLDLLLLKKFKFSVYNLSAACYSPNNFPTALDWWITNKLSLDGCLVAIASNSYGKLDNIKLFVEKTGYVPTKSDYKKSPKTESIRDYFANVMEKDKTEKAIKRRELVATKMLHFLKVFNEHKYCNYTNQKQDHDTFVDILTELDSE